MENNTLQVLGIQKKSEQYFLSEDKISVFSGELTDGLLVKQHDGYPAGMYSVYSIENGIEKLLTEYDQTRFFHLRLWILSMQDYDEVPDILLGSQYKETPQDVRNLFSLLKKPMLCFDDYIAILNEANELLADVNARYGATDHNYLDWEMFDGISTKTISVNGKTHDSVDRVIKPVEEGVWDSFYIERGEEYLEARFHDQEALYQHLLDLRVQLMI